MTQTIEPVGPAGADAPPATTAEPITERPDGAPDRADATSAGGGGRGADGGSNEGGDGGGRPRRGPQRGSADLRLRRRLMLWGIPGAVLLLLVAAKLVSMSIVGAETVRLYEAKDYEGALNSASQQHVLNVIETWKAPYDTGTSYLQLGVNDRARDDLTAALGLATGADRCPVRANLAIAHERLGDALHEAGDEDGARGEWQQGLELLQQQEQECPSSTSNQSMQSTQQRLEQKLSPPQPKPDDGKDGGQQGQPPVSDGTKQDLEDKLGQNNQATQDATSDERNQNGGGSGYYDRPW